jgi:Flp pilus assembly protein protease CpaA
MIEVVFLICLAVIFTVFAVVQDFKNREVSNWLNFSLVIFALGFRFFYSLFEAGNFNFFYQGLFGFIIFFVIGNLFYYGHVFAGGDAKLMISYGAILPFFNDFFSNVKFFILFLFLFLFVGAFYGIFYTIPLSIKNSSKFRREFVRWLSKIRNFVYSFIFIGIIFLIFGFVNEFFFLAGIFVFLLPFVFVFAKSVDESSMVKRVKTSLLREGDWLYKDVKIGRRNIKSSWDGLSLSDIKFLKGKKKFVYIREGIPFTPVFFVAFLSLVFIWSFNLFGAFWFFGF